MTFDTAVASTTWFPVVTLILGAVLKSLADWLTNLWASKREREARNQQRRDALLLKRAEFQRATLIELQDELGKYGRLCGQFYLKDATLYREKGSWGQPHTTDEIGEALRVSTGALQRLRVRVHDQSVRQQTATLIDVSGQIIFASHEAAAIDALQRMMEIAANINEAVGTALRALDEIEDSTLVSRPTK